MEKSKVKCELIKKFETAETALLELINHISDNQLENDVKCEIDLNELYYYLNNSEVVINEDEVKSY